MAYTVTVYDGGTPATFEFSSAVRAFVFAAQEHRQGNYVVLSTKRVFTQKERREFAARMARLPQVEKDTEEERI